jgi:putative lipoprotein
MALFACGGESDAVNAAAGSAMATLNGQVVLQPRGALQLDASVRVRLEDVSRADAPAMIIAETTFPAKGHSSPIPFALEYDPTRIDERYRYAVRAEIRDARKRLLWVTTTHHGALTQGAPSDGIQVTVEPVTRPH